MMSRLVTCHLCAKQAVLLAGPQPALTAVCRGARLFSQAAKGGLTPEATPTGGLYESARTDREPMPSPLPGTEQLKQDSQASPPGCYPLQSDPAAALEHPSEAFQSPAEASTGPGGPNNDPSGGHKHGHATGIPTASPAFPGGDAQAQASALNWKTEAQSGSAGSSASSSNSSPNATGGDLESGSGSGSDTTVGAGQERAAAAGGVMSQSSGYAGGMDG